MLRHWLIVSLAAVISSMYLALPKAAAQNNTTILGRGAYNNNWGYNGYGPVGGLYPTGGGSYYYRPGTYSPASEEDHGPQAFITVRVPTADTQLWFGGHRTRQSGTVRVFETPPLGRGAYQYQVRAQWPQDGRMLNETRTVRVRPGETLTVDFGRFSAEPPMKHAKTVRPQ
jgi:uncharacterized protein (TIGR03000 family)